MGDIGTLGHTTHFLLLPEARRIFAKFQFFAVGPRPLKGRSGGAAGPGQGEVPCFVSFDFLSLNW